MLIKYTFATGEITEVEVSEEIGAVVLDLDRQEYNTNHKETRRHCSLNALDQDDNLLPSDEDLEKALVNKELNCLLYEGIEQLTPRQKTLVTEVYFNGRKIKDVAKSEGISNNTASEILTRAKKYLKKFLIRHDFF